MDSRLPQRASRLLQEDVQSHRTLQGGGLSEVVRLTLGSGISVVAKSGPYPGREARMLTEMADAGANVPLPIASNQEVLLLEDLGDEASPTDHAWQSFGKQLRAFHTVSGERYGWRQDYAFGTLKIHNGWKDNWPEFWFERRLAADIQSLPGDVARRLESLQSIIARILPDHPRPSLLHGDLWSGNVHFSANGTAYMIDPASYYGHAEVDLAMLTLFGSPPDLFWEYYGRLEEGWALRRSVYQLWPALVHLRLFGDGYRTMVDRLIENIER